MSPEAVQKYPNFFGCKSLPFQGGDSSGGVGIWRIGRGIERLLAIGSVTPGMDGMSGGSDNCGSGLGSAIGDPTAVAAIKDVRVKRANAMVADV